MMLDWGLQFRAHRGWRTLLLFSVIHLLGWLLSGGITPLIGLMGPQPVPTVCIVSVLTGPTLVWWVQQRSEVEQVSVRRLVPVTMAVGWGLAVVPAIAIACFTVDGQLYLRGVIATIGSTTTVWQLSRGSWSSLPAVAVFCVTMFVGRLAPGITYWGWYLIRGDWRTWIIPVLLTLTALPVFSSRTTLTRSNPEAP